MNTNFELIIEAIIQISQVSRSESLISNIITIRGISGLNENTVKHDNISITIQRSQNDPDATALVSANINGQIYSEDILKEILYDILERTDMLDAKLKIKLNAILNGQKLQLRNILRTSELIKLKDFKIIEGELGIFVLNEQGEHAPEIQVAYKNNRILAIYEGGYVIMDLEQNIVEENLFEALENRPEYLNLICYEIVKILHHLTTNIFGLKTDCKSKTVNTLIEKLDKAHPEENLWEKDMLIYLLKFYHMLEFLGASINPYDVKNYD